MSLSGTSASQLTAQSLGRKVDFSGGDAAPCKPHGAGALLPQGFVDELYLSDLDQATLLAHDEIGRLYVVEKAGRVLVVEQGRILPAPLVDISEEVGNFGNAGLLGFALDPDFYTNGYVYLMYVVDKHHLLHFGTPSYDPLANQFNESTIGRITRYTATPASNFTEVDPASRRVLLGESMTTGVPFCGDHFGGALTFFEDGTLAASTGDGGGDQLAGPSCTEEGIVSPLEDIGLHRAQLIDSLNGKLLRLDPTTGDGLPDNPFYAAAMPRAARSRVWSVGLRNPFRMSVRPDSGSQASSPTGALFVGDVGAALWEELNVASEAGQNFGWPLFEGLAPEPGGAGSLQPNYAAPNQLFGLDIPGFGLCTQEFFYVQDLLVEDTLLPPSWPNPCFPLGEIAPVHPRFTHRRPALAWGHFVGPAVVPDFDAGGLAIQYELGAVGSPVAGASFAGNCSIGGAWYDGISFPPAYFGTYFHADLGSAWIRCLRFDAEDRLIEVQPFAEAAGAVVSMSVDPLEGKLYYIDYGEGGNASIHRIAYEDGNLPPEAAAKALPAWGPAPLRVRMDGSKSVDPEGQPLSVRWEFSDGSPPSVQTAPVRYFPAVDITDRGKIVSKLDVLDPPHSMGLGNPDPEVIRDGVFPGAGVSDIQLQIDTWHFDEVSLQPDKGAFDYIGYEFDGTHTITGLIYQEGVRWEALFGGWWNTLEVQVRLPGTQSWTAVSNLQVTQPYTALTAANGFENFQTFELVFAPVQASGVRLFGAPGGTFDFVSVAELRVMALPKHGLGEPRRIDATAIVTDPLGNADCADVSVWIDNTPPEVKILSPTNGASVTNQQPVQVLLRGHGEDLEDLPDDLVCQWQVILHHDNHTHPEPVTSGCSATALLLPHEMDPGDVIYYECRFTATDSLGLATSATSYLYLAEDCNLNGVQDAHDIASGASLDVNGNGVPDECEADCDRDGLHDLFELALGTQVDANRDLVPDDCP